VGIEMGQEQVENCVGSLLQCLQLGIL